MKLFLTLIVLTVCLVSISASAQNNLTKTNDPVANIANEVVNIAKSLETLNKKLQYFTETFSSNQGLKLTDKQQKLLAAFEFLNRAEQRLATLQKLKIDLAEKQSSIKTKLSEIDDALRPESIDRSVSLRGSLNAEELRDHRRQILFKERNEHFVLLNEILHTLNDTSVEIKQTEQFLKNIRQRIFPEIEKELSDL